MNKKNSPITMKGGFLIATLITIGMICIAYLNKENKPVLDGIFELRLGMTEKQLREIVDITLLEDTIDTDLPWSRSIIAKKGIKDLYLKKYEVKNNYNIENITFSFLNDTLYRIIINKHNLKTEELLTKKYGEPKVERLIFPKDVEGVQQQWHTNSSDIKCTSLNFDETSDDYYCLCLLEKKRVDRIQKEIANDKKKDDKEKETQKKKTEKDLLDKL